MWLNIRSTSGVTDKFSKIDCSQAQEAQKTCPTIFMCTKSVADTPTTSTIDATVLLHNIYVINYFDFELCWHN